MELPDQVVSLELAKRLKELGVKQESLTYWLPIAHEIILEDEAQEDGSIITKRIVKSYKYQLGNPFAWDIPKEQTWSAFTSEELFELLPAFIIDIGISEPFNSFWLHIKKRNVDNIKYIANYICDSMPGEEIENPYYQMCSRAKAHDESLANCLAKMLIFLLENNLINKETK